MINDNMPYSVVISYKRRMEKNDKKYTVCSYASKILLCTNSKYELLIYLDLNGKELGKIIGEKYLIKNFNKKWSQTNIFKIFGRAYRLRKKRV